jgi:hypothetical protein
VAPAHSYKFGAELQHDQAGDAPVLLRIETATGHHGEPKRVLAAEFADMLAFAAEHTSSMRYSCRGTTTAVSPPNVFRHDGCHNDT